MNRQELKKNRLDLEYHGEAQKRNAFLILLTTGLVGFIGTFIWLRDTNLFLIGVAIALAIFGFGYVLYINTSRKMKEILEAVENIR